MTTGTRNTLRRLAVWAAASVVAASCVAAAGDLGELSLVAGYTSGDYGTDVESDTHSFTVRYVTGKAFTFRAELPLLHVRAASTFVRTGLGPAPFGTRQQDGLGRGAASSTAEGSGQQGGNGSGNGNGSGGADFGNGNGVNNVGTGDGSSASLEFAEDLSGVGDLRLAVGRRFAGGGARLFRVDGGAQVKAPTADSDEGLGTGEWDIRAGVTGEYRFWSVTLYGGAGLNYLGDPEWVELNDVADLYVGLEGPAFRDRVVISGWLDGHEEIVNGAGAAVVAGLEIRAAGRAGWRGVLSFGLTDGAEDVGVMFGRSFSGADQGFRGMLR